MLSACIVYMRVGPSCNVAANDGLLKKGYKLNPLGDFFISMLVTSKTFKEEAGTGEVIFINDDIYQKEFCK